LAGKKHRNTARYKAKKRIVRIGTMTFDVDMAALANAVAAIRAQTDGTDDAVMKEICRRIGIGTDKNRPPAPGTVQPS
jgi:hypothetical protein